MSTNYSSTKRAYTTTRKNAEIEEMELRECGYKLGKKLGEGSYAAVVSAIQTDNNRQVAIKIVRLDKAPEDFVNKFFPRELEILSKLRHPNVIRMYDHFDLFINSTTTNPEKNTYIIMEVAGRGDLLDYVKLRTRLTEGRTKFLFKQLINAIDYLHTNFVIHRDLKCENLLLDNNNNLKISDFGFARYMYPEDDSVTYCGSAAYAAPEVLKGQPYRGFAFDIWSCGIILYIMVCGKMPFDDSNLDELLKMQCEKHIIYPTTVSHTLSRDVKDLIEDILEPDYKKRPGLDAISDSRWMTGVPYVIVESIDQFQAVIQDLERTVEPGVVKTKTKLEANQMEKEVKRPEKHRARSTISTGIKKFVEKIRLPSLNKTRSKQLTSAPLNRQKDPGNYPSSRSDKKPHTDPHKRKTHSSDPKTGPNDPNEEMSHSSTSDTRAKQSHKRDSIVSKVMHGIIGHGNHQNMRHR